jgi:HD-like signal output (HDOD) protein
MLKEIIRINLSSDIYLAGLLHDVGILALDQIKADFYPHLLDPESSLKKDLSTSENALIGVDHGQAGCWYAESLGLPQFYLDVILHHHFPEKATSNSLSVALVHLADLFAMSRDCGVGNDGYEPEITNSFGWVILQDQHRPFLDVHLPDFIETFNKELSKTWSGITDGLDF